MKKIKKNTKPFQNERKNYESIRDIISSMYLEPSINLDARYTKLSASQRDMLRRILNYIEPVYINKTTVENTSVTTFVTDMYKCPVNYLADTYRYASYTHDQLLIYLTFMQLISTAGSLDETGEGITDFSTPFYKKDLCGDVNDRLSNINTTAAVENMFDDLVDMGIIEKYKSEDNTATSKQRYIVSNDVLNNIDNLGLLNKLLEMVIFFYNIHPVAVPGYMLAHTIYEYLIYSFPKDDQILHYMPSSDIFIYKNKALHNTIYNNITWKILEAIHDKNIINFDYTEQDNKVVKRNIVPEKIIIEYEYNRQYCYGYDPETNIYYTARIDKINNLQIITDSKHIKPANTNFEKDFEHKWMVADSLTCDYVKVIFMLPEDEKLRENLITKINTTKRKGTIKQADNNTIIYETNTTNQLELVPWINGFGRYAMVDKDINPFLYNKLKEHNNELMVKYGLI
ncbi:MAG: WYL domain-containing protein [Mucispirillum sp.]|nr:WYL domain-containing protein [Mucispirillum sp.]